MSDQDWTEVVIHRKKTRAETGQTAEQRAARARQQGVAVSSERKGVAGANRQRSTAPKHAAAIDAVGTDREPEVVHHHQVSHNVALRIQQARQAKGWTQKELAARICEKPQVVNDYEAGRAIPSQQVLAKMERELGAKIRGK